MKFKGATIRSVKADLAKEKITISVVLDLDEQTMELATELAGVCVGKDSKSATVEIIPDQPKLL